MFADVMVRVTGFAFVTSTPSAVSEPETQNLPRCLLLLPGAPDRCHTMYHRITVRVRQRGFVHQDTLQPFTGPSIGPSPMASITLIICVDLRLSFASTGVCLAATFTHSVPLSCLMSDV